MSRASEGGSALREHDGFFLRLALGGGGLSMKRSGSITQGGNSPYYTGDSHIGGGAGVTEVTIGGNLTKGLVLAGTLLAHQNNAPTLERNGDTDIKLDGPLRFPLLGVTLEWFPDPRRGFHAGATLALAGAWAKAPQPAFAENLGGAGGALSLSVGYLWWIGDQWSLGVLARLTGAHLHGETTVLTVKGSEDDNVSAAALLLDIVYQ